MIWYAKRDDLGGGWFFQNLPKSSMIFQNLPKSSKNLVKFFMNHPMMKDDSSQIFWMIWCGRILFYFGPKFCTFKRTVFSLNTFLFVFIFQKLSQHLPHGKRNFFCFLECFFLVTSYGNFEILWVWFLLESEEKFIFPWGRCCDNFWNKKTKIKVFRLKSKNLAWAPTFSVSMCKILCQIMG